MPLPIIPALPFPNVPNLPGVPNVPRALPPIGTVPGSVNAQATANIASGPAAGIAAILQSILGTSPGATTIGVQAPADVLFQAANSAVKWGIFDSNNRLVVDPDSIVDFAKRSEWRVANFPVQAGQFASYNKVKVPFDISVRLTKGGSTLDRTTFLQQLDTVSASLALYTILTPEQSYLGCNIMRVEITRRGKLGAYFIDAEVFFQQIIEVTPQYSSTNVASSTANANPDTAIPSQQQGVVQAQTPSPSTVTTTTNDLTNGGN